VMNKNNKKNVLLIIPATDENRNRKNTMIPIGLLNLATSIQDEYNVKIIDVMNSNNYVSEIKDSINDDTIAVGISSMTGYQIIDGINCAKFVREINPEIPIICGGIHPSLLPEETLKNEYVDFVVVGEGTKTFSKLLKDLKNKKRIIYSECFEDLNTLPLPNFSFLDTDKYFDEISGISIETSKGCYHKCNYCYNSAYNKGTYRFMSPEKTLEYIEYVINKFKLNKINLYEDNFFCNRQRVETVCDMIIKKGLKLDLQSTCRIDYICSYSEEFLEKMKKAGFNCLYIGVESGSQRVLNYIQKDITINQIIVANRKLKKAGIQPKYSFMGGFPTETKKEFIETIKLMRKLINENNKALCTPIQLFAPYPKTKLYDYSIANGYEPPKKLEEYGKSNWNKIEHSWLSDEDKKFLEVMSYVTYFVDGKSIAKYYKEKLFYRLLNMIYGWSVRFRIGIGFYFFPEYLAIKKRFCK
jgi:anaerobic magnesium-protoporphyrin IX monomethyl ester cyclase